MTFIGEKQNSGWDARGNMGGGILSILPADGEVDIAPAPNPGIVRLLSPQISSLNTGALIAANAGPDPVTVNVYYNTPNHQFQYASNNINAGAVGGLDHSGFGMYPRTPANSFSIEVVSGTGPIKVWAHYVDLDPSWHYADALIGENGSWSTVLSGPSSGKKRILFSPHAMGDFLGGAIVMNEDANALAPSFRIASANHVFDDATLGSVSSGEFSFVQGLLFGNGVLRNGESIEGTTDTTFADDGIRFVSLYKDVPSLD